MWSLIRDPDYHTVTLHVLQERSVEAGSTRRVVHLVTEPAFLALRNILYLHHCVVLIHFPWLNRFVYSPYHNCFIKIIYKIFLCVQPGLPKDDKTINLFLSVVSVTHTIITSILYTEVWFNELAWYDDSWFMSDIHIVDIYLSKSPLWTLDLRYSIYVWVG